MLTMTGMANSNERISWNSNRVKTTCEIKESRWVPSDLSPYKQMEQNILFRKRYDLLNIFTFSVSIYVWLNIMCPHQMKRIWTKLKEAGGVCIPETISSLLQDAWMHVPSWPARQSDLTQ